METALEIISRLGTDNPPTLDELTSARDTIARELHALKGNTNVDLEAVMSLRDAYAVSAQAVTEFEAAAEAATTEVEDILADVPDPDAEKADETEETAEVASVLTVREAVERLGLVERPTQTVEVVSEPEPTLADTTTTVMIGNKEMPEATFDDLVAAFSKAGKSLKQGKETVASIFTTFPEERTLNGKKGDNTRLIDSFVSPEAVSAAGGCCSLPTPIYENPVSGSTARPIRDSLPTVGTPRGAVTFFPAVCIPQAGSAIWTCEDDADVDPEDPDTWKQCADVECEDSQTVQIDAIYKCLTIGNFQHRFANEQWQAHLKALNISHARLAEVALFSKMRAGVTSTHTGLATGSTALNVVNTAIRATNLMRQDQRLAEIEFNLTIADWVKGAIAEGWGINRLDKGGSFDDVEAWVAQQLAKEGIRVVYSLDIDDLEDFQYDGDLAAYPETAAAVLAPQGYFSFLDGGELNFGTDSVEIRDHELNRQNKLATFGESFEGLLARGCNAKALDIPIECDLTVACPS